MTKSTFKLFMVNKNLQQIMGYLIFDYSSNKIHITSLLVYPEFQKQGVGTVLMIFFICFVINNIDDAKFIKKISLDDCSALNRTKDSIYYKFCYRISDSFNEEKMELNFLTTMTDYKIKKQYTYPDESFPSVINFSTIYDYYNHLLDKYNEILEKIKLNKDNIIFEMSYYDYQTKNTQHIKYLDIDNCLIKKEDMSNNYFLRSTVR